MIVHLGDLLWVNIFFVDTSATKSALSSQGFIEILDFQNLCWLNFFNNDLGNSVVFPKVLIK